ncbi:hypothetical protein GCM10009608_34210 [Pseudonocardia alaniniphila]
MGVGADQIEVARHRPVVDDEHGLDQPGDPGRGLQVPDVGLDRADDHRPIRRAPGPENRGEGRDLDGVAERGTGAVALDVADVGARHPGHGERAGDHVLLGGPARHGEPGAGTVLVHRRPADHGEDVLAVAHRGVEATEHDDTAALAAHVPVGAAVEGVALTSRGQHVALREGDRRLRRQQQVHSADQRRVALAEPQRLARQVHCHQR